ncbi:MAG: DUF924 family protein [Betaproteobacteria bacterium]
MRAVIEYWFGASTDAAEAVADRDRLWWKADPAIDDDVRARFANCVEQAGRHELDDWAATAHGLLALILLTDQFPRNIFRGTTRAFSFDPIARAHCHAGIARGVDTALRPIERVFHYLPLEHSELLSDQDDSVRLFARLAGEAGRGNEKLFAGYLRYARRHREIIARFGRFPHRNGILGRASTPEEVAFLQTPGSSF